MINVAVDKNNNENNLNLLRRFTKRVQGSGILNRVRGIRYHSRQESELSKKRMALRYIERKETAEKLMKLGKIKQVARR